MKITFVGTLPPLKALSPYCYHLAEALSKKIDLEFVSFKEILPDFLYWGGTKEKNTIEFQKVKAKRYLNWYNPFSLIKSGITLTGDILHVQHWSFYSGIAYSVLIPIAKIRKKKVIITVHNITPHTGQFIDILIDKIFNKIIFPFADIFIVHNERNKAKLIKLYRINNDKIYILPHGTTYPYQQIQGITKKEAREKLRITLEKKVILFFGYIWDYKGLDTLLRSMEYIKNKTPNVLLLIAGQPGKKWIKYEKIIEKKDLTNVILKALHYIPDSELEYYFSGSDLVVCPYKKHPFDTHGGVGSLALAFKKPIVVTDVGGLPEYILDKRAIVNPEDINDLAEKISTILNDDRILKKMSNDSNFLSEKLSWDKIADKTIQLYKNLL